MFLKCLPQRDFLIVAWLLRSIESAAKLDWTFQLRTLVFGFSEKCPQTCDLLIVDLLPRNSFVFERSSLLFKNTYQEASPR